MKAVIITDLNKVLQDKMQYIGFDRNLEARFPEKNFSIPVNVMRSVIQWSWLKWNIDRNVTEIGELMAKTVERGLHFKALSASQSLRAEHDLALLFASILSGNKRLMLDTANAVDELRENHLDDKTERAVVGVLKFSLIQDEDKMKTQLGYFLQQPKSKLHPWPRSIDLEFLSTKNPKLTSKIFKSICKAFWENYQKANAISEFDDKLVVDVQKIPNNFRWPWLQAALLKIGLLHGLDVDMDDFWLPNPFLKHFS